MARESNSPYADWRPIPLTECIWLNPGGVGGDYALPPTTAFAADQLAGQLNGGGETPKITMSAGTAFYNDFGDSANQGFWYSLPLPDFLFDKQPGRLPAWDGLQDTPMDLDGQLMRAIQFENVLIGGTGQGGVQAPDLLFFTASVKYRGFGSNIDAATPSQDQNIVAFDPLSNPTAFPGMILTGFNLAPGTGPAVVFDDPDALSIARIRTLVLVPFTCAMGDQLEAVFSLTFASPVTVGLQWHSARYRWLDGFPGPLPQTPNTCVQLLGQDADGYQQLFGQSRLDDLPYEP